MNDQIHKFEELIKSNKYFVLTTHINPDGDGLGTEVALALYLTSIKKEVSIINCDPVPDNYLFLDKLFPILCFDAQKHQPIIYNADVIIILDANELKRINNMETAVKNSKAIKACIDHHLEPTDFADIYFTNDQSPATAEVVYDLLHSIDKHFLTKDIATALYTGIMTDTGSFRFPNTNSKTHRITAELLEAGANPSAIYQHIYENLSSNYLQLIGLALSNLKLEHNGKIAYIVITREMLKTTGISTIDSDFFIPYTMAIKGVQIGILFTELEDEIKISFRSKGNIPVNELAKEFGGGGHKNAAGARMNTILQNSVRNILCASVNYIKKIEAHN